MLIDYLKFIIFLTYFDKTHLLYSSIHPKIRYQSSLYQSISQPSTGTSPTVFKTPTISGLNIEAIQKDDFPILATEAYPGKPLVFLDSGASSQKPNAVLSKMDNYYKTSHSNVHRGAHALAMKATTLYEWSRDQIQQFIHAKHREEIIFTRGASEAINIVALSYSSFLSPGDEIILSVMEHHSNLVPWQMVAKRTGAILKFVNLTENMEFDFQHYVSLLSDKTKFVAVSHSSNVLGSINPIVEIIHLAHSFNAKVLIDACQSVPHMPVDVQALDADFLVASGHKMCGPTGIGFLYGKLNLLRAMPPVYGGGEMIDRVDWQTSSYALPPSKFEAGTPAIAEAVGLGAACEYLTNIGMNKVFHHDLLLGHYLYEELQKIESLTLYGPKPKYNYQQIYDILHQNDDDDDDDSSSGTSSSSDGTSSSSGNSSSGSGKTTNMDFASSTLLSSDGLRTGLVSFNCATVHPTDLSFFLDQEGVALRTGHHCTQPLHRQFGIAGSIRASVYLYNSKEDIDIFIHKLKETINMFQQMSHDNDSNQ